MRSATPSRTTRLRAAAIIAAAATVGLSLAACQPEPSPSGTPTPSVSASPSGSDPAPTPSPTEPSQAGFTFPETCEAIYSPAMLTTLNAQNPPLNDPGVTMTSTQNVEALDLLSSGIATIRCSWGQPSEFGLATNVSSIDETQSQALLAAFTNAGFACEAFEEGTICRVEQTVVDQDDNIVTIGEVHFLRTPGWVSSAFINFAPEGYTEDIVATLWG